MASRGGSHTRLPPLLLRHALPVQLLHGFVKVGKRFLGPFGQFVHGFAHLAAVLRGQAGDGGPDRHTGSRGGNGGKVHSKSLLCLRGGAPPRVRR